MSLPEKFHAFKVIHLYLSSCASFVKKHCSFIHSIKDSNVQCSVSCQITNMRKSYFRFVFKIDFPEFMICGTFKSTPFKKRKKMLGANRLRPKLNGFEWHRKHCHRCE